MDLKALEAEVLALKQKLEDLRVERIDQDRYIPNSIKTRHLEEGIELTSPTLSSGTFTDPIFNGSISGTAFLDEDTMSSNSATKLASQQSIKAYVDTSVAGISVPGGLVDEDDNGAASTSSGTAAAITGADVSVTLTDTSHIVIIGSVSAYQNSGADAPYSIQWHDGTSLVGVEMRVELRTGNPRDVTTCFYIAQNKTAATYTYTLYHRSQNGSATITAEVVNCIAFSIPV